MTSFQAPKGTRDIFGDEGARLSSLVARFAGLCRLAGYEIVISPMFEDAGVFRRGVGEASEVVTKEMYEFEDKAGRLLALRPEGTASVVRAYLEHRPPSPWKAWYVTPAFRYESPQAGRYRQHHQVGVELIGTPDADADVEVIALAAGYFAAAGLAGVDLKVNSMGDGDCLPAYRDALGTYLESRAGELCDEHRATWARNPLRVLDCKRAECVAVREGAPRLSDWLCGPCREHFERVLTGLDALSIPWRRDDFLVRGLDYYRRTTFEFASTSLDAAQNAIGGGGRYDGLAELLGGPATPGVGFASGIERVLLACEAEGCLPAPAGVAAFVVDLTDGASARDLSALLRAAGVATGRGFDGRSLKSQLKLADRSGATVAVIVGADELAAGTLTVRALRGEHAHEQLSIPRDGLVAEIRKWLP